MASPDPYVPDDLKRNGLRRKVPAFLAGTENSQQYPDGRPVSRPPTAFVPQPQEAAVPRTIEPTRDAVEAGPPLATPVDGAMVTPPSRLDREAPLPDGVRMHKVFGGANDPRTNDVIYEGARGAHGERTFSNNQFAQELRPRGLSPERTAELDTGMAMRSKEIAGSVDSQARAAAAAQQAARLAPQSVGDLKTLAEANKLGAETGGIVDKTARDRQLGILNVEGKANENEMNNRWQKRAEEIGKSFGEGVPEAVRQRMASVQVAREMMDQGILPESTGIGRAGDQIIRQQLAAALNNGQATLMDSAWFGGGSVNDPTVVDPTQYQFVPEADNPAGNMVITGPRDERTGAQRRVVASVDPSLVAYSQRLAGLRAALKRARGKADKISGE